MKKQYAKPKLYAESFRLVEHISQCAWGLSFGTDCALQVGSEVFFTQVGLCSESAVNLISFAMPGDLSDYTADEILNTMQPECYNGTFAEYSALHAS